jgi:hypothetical protein
MTALKKVTIYISGPDTHLRHGRGKAACRGGQPAGAF